MRRGVAGRGGRSARLLVLTTSIGSPGWLAEVPEECRTPMGGQTITGEYARLDPCLIGKGLMPDAIRPAEHREEQPLVDPPVDPARRQSGLEELLGGDHRLLLAGAR